MNINNLNELISVIVPIYNVEKYLDNCILSILNQSYANLEIILVDDGSTDKSGIIADSYKSKDVRIKVIHKLNGGLSDARNVGIDNSKGTYITFIDSDDYIPQYSIEYLYHSIKTNNCEISVGKLLKTSNLNESTTNVENFYFIFNSNESINQLLYSNLYSVAAPGKLYLRSLFDGVRFPIGKLYEDAFTTYKIFNKAKSVFYGDQIVYYYYHRIGSIMLSSFNIKKLDIIEALEQIQIDLKIDEIGCSKGYASQTVEDMYMLLELSLSKEIIKEYKIWERIKKYRSLLIFDKKCSKRVRGYSLLSYLGINLSVRIYKLYRYIKWNF